LPSDGEVPSGRAEGRVVRALKQLGFELIRDRQHIQMRRRNPDGSITPLTMPSHRTIKSSTLRVILTQAGISRQDFLQAYER
jgi:predicted RNA binding protein YcfA (HicA-like mRNA interferase family)